MALKTGRNPFARETITKHSVGKGCCTWCGMYRRLWQYVVEPDYYSKGNFEIRGHFCSIGCLNDYHQS